MDLCAHEVHGDVGTVCVMPVQPPPVLPSLPHGGFYDAYEPAASSGTQKHQIKSCYSCNMLIVRYGFIKLSKKTHKHTLPVASIPGTPESTLTSRRRGPDKNLGECALLS